MVWGKNKGGQAPQVSPLDLPLITMIILYKIELRILI